MRRHRCRVFYHGPQPQWGGNPPPPVIRALIMKFCLNLPVKVAVKLSVETVLAWFTESKNS